ncbi:replicative DNA helicase [Sulfuritalea sp.]|uniref:replicative DNA helicase n=1 Tax=Sulfuritalea sp. TaxID=2480090 RepID=UPI001ACFC533|nr:replicative DNA helicase [Sulfuritalea sp.]MBN8474405.1 replicative DNA helicase [Sulfuritalea sp.]
MNAPVELRLPPHSVEAEQSLIGGLLIDPRAWDHVADLVSDSDFFRDDHRRIFRHIARLIGSGRPVDVVTVFESVERSNEVDQTGGLGYLGEIANTTPSIANIRRYAEIIRDKAVLRGLIAAADALAAACFAGGVDGPEKIAQAADASLARALDRGAEDPITATDAMRAALVAADDRQQSGHPGGLDTGIAGLDRLTGGLVPGQLFVVAARPSIGKSAIALGIADHIARAGGRVVVFSLEMSRQELAARLLAASSGVSGRVLRSGPSDDEWGRLSGAMCGSATDRIVLDDKSAATVAYVRARCRRLHRQGALSLVVVDYLQLMTPADPRANRSEQVGSLSRGLKHLAKEIGVPVIALAQLNRSVESRAGGRPQLSDLRDSGEIEQDADLIALLSRVVEPAEGENAIVELALRKHRNGPCGDVLLAFDAARMTFAPYGGPRPSGPARPARSGFDG